MVKPSDETVLVHPPIPPSSGSSPRRAEEFIAHGLRGARMQAIADRAGVNKALVHYYFRSKEKLYDAVLQDTMRTIIAALHQELPAKGAKRSPHPHTADRCHLHNHAAEKPGLSRGLSCANSPTAARGCRRWSMLAIVSFGDIPRRINALLKAEMKRGRFAASSPCTSC